MPLHICITNSLLNGTVCDNGGNFRPPLIHEYEAEKNIILDKCSKEGYLQRYVLT
jgi:hypothetical protein